MRIRENTMVMVVLIEIIQDLMKDLVMLEDQQLLHQILAKTMVLKIKYLNLNLNRQHHLILAFMLDQLIKLLQEFLIRLGFQRLTQFQMLHIIQG